MNWDDQIKLTAMSRLGKEVWVNDRETGMPMLWGIVEDEVSIVVDSAKHVIQRIRFADAIRQGGESHGYRNGSFIVDARSGSIKWAQYSQTLLESEYRELLLRLQKRGWPIL